MAASVVTVPEVESSCTGILSPCWPMVSLMRGGQFYYEDVPVSPAPPAPAAASRPGVADGAAPNGQTSPAASPAPPLPRGTGVT